jgi:hypothetical protein
MQSHYSILRSGDRKAARKKISELKNERRKAESRDKRESREKVRQEKLAAKLGEEKVKSMAKVKNRVLAAFKAKPDHTLNTLGLQQIAPEATRRVRELRADGWEITKRYNGKLGVYEYTLDETKSTAEGL